MVEGGAVAVNAGSRGGGKLLGVERGQREEGHEQAEGDERDARSFHGTGEPRRRMCLGMSVLKIGIRK